MSVVVASTRHLKAFRACELVSPELALVDPVLASRARIALPEPPDSLVHVRSGWIAVASRGPAEAPAIPPAADWAPAPEAGRHGLRSLGAIAVVAVVSIAVLLLLDARVEVGRPPASPERRAVSQGPASGPDRLSDQSGPQPAIASSPKTAQRGSMQVPRRFAWAPDDRATGYHVEFFRGSVRIFVRDVTRPEITLPSGWTFRGSRSSLESGEYRWYVWPLVSGQRLPSAIVQAKLVVRP